MRHPLAALLLLLATGLAAAEPGRLVIALKPDKDPEAMAAERAQLAAVLAPALARPVDVIVPLSGAVIAEGLANGSLDAAFVSAADLVKLPEPRPATVLLAAQVRGATSYRSVWLVRADAPYAGIADLRGRPVAFASRTSTSGCVVPLWDLHRRGLLGDAGPAAFFGPGNCWYGTGYVSAVERLLAGDAEAAAVSDYVYDGDKHLRPEQKARLRVLASQGPVPTHVLAVRRTLAASERDALRAAAAGLEAGLRDRLFGGPLVAVDEEAHLRPAAEAFAIVSRLRL